MRGKCKMGYLRLSVMPVFKWLILSTECCDDRILHHALDGKSTNTPVWAKALKAEISIVAVTLNKTERLK